MGEPTSAAEYEARYHAHQKVTGFGIDGMRVHLPCPFCAADGFAVYALFDMERVLGAGATCAECGRGARLAASHPGIGTTRIMWVQTSGADPAMWVRWIQRQTLPAPAESDPADKSLEG